MFQDIKIIANAELLVTVVLDQGLQKLLTWLPPLLPLFIHLVAYLKPPSGLFGSADTSKCLSQSSQLLGLGLRLLSQFATCFHALVHELYMPVSFDSPSLLCRWLA